MVGDCSGVASGSISGSGTSRVSAARSWEQKASSTVQSYLASASVYASGGGTGVRSEIPALEACGVFAVPAGVLCESKPVRTVSFDPSGRLLAVGSNDASLKVCQVPRDCLQPPHCRRRRREEDAGRGPHSSSKPVPKVMRVLHEWQGLHRASVYCCDWSTSVEESREQL